MSPWGQHLVRLGVALGLLLGAWGCPSSATRNLTDSWDAFAQRADGLNPPEALAAFQRSVVPEFPEFYRWRLDRLGDQAAQTVVDHVLLYKAERLRFQRFASRFQRRLDDALPSFRKAFGSFEPPTIYLLHSLGELDGGTRTIGGRVYFLFGVDNMVRYHAFDNEMPFFHHELFHVFRAARVPEVKTIISALYEEGLAVYVSHQLNPRATAAELLLDAPKGMVSRCRERFAEVARVIVDKARGSDGEAYKGLFLMRSAMGLPPRCGYWVGYWLAHRIRKGRSLAQLAGLTGEPLWQELEAEMKRFAADGPPSTDLVPF